MSGLGKLIRMIAALMCLGAAFIFLREAGLPQRAAYSGYRFQNGGYLAPEVGAIAPPINLLTWDYRPFSLDPKAAPVTIVNFWATWCIPCRAELAQLQALHDSEPGSIRIVAINLGESPMTVANWKRELRLDFYILIDPSQISAKSYRIRGLPTTFLLGSDLRVHRIYYGAWNRQQLLSDLGNILKGR